MINSRHTRTIRTEQHGAAGAWYLARRRIDDPYRRTMRALVRAQVAMYSALNR